MYRLLSMAGEGSTSGDPGPLQRRDGIATAAGWRARIRAGARGGRSPGGRIRSKWGRIGKRAEEGERALSDETGARTSRRLEARSFFLFPDRQTPDSTCHLSGELIQGHPMSPLPGMDHEVHRGKSADIRSKPLPQKPLDPVSLDRSAASLRHRQPEARSPQIIRRAKENEAFRGGLSSVLIDALILPSLPDSVGGSERPPKTHTASLFLPFRRRRFNTSRPSWVLMRFRKPWVRLRRRLLGWNVRFMHSPPARCWCNSDSVSREC
jgi:hypothetical protein